MAEKLTVLELFAGIGGCAAAIAGNAEIVTAVETAHDALTVYRHNFVSPTLDQPVESLPENWFREFRAAVWWMSPPVLPFVNAGLRRELDDPRAKALLHVIEQIHKIRPRYVAARMRADIRQVINKAIIARDARGFWIQVARDTTMSDIAGCSKSKTPLLSRRWTRRNSAVEAFELQAAVFSAAPLLIASLSMNSLLYRNYSPHTAIPCTLSTPMTRRLFRRASLRTMADQ